MVEADRRLTETVALNTSGITQTIDLDVLNVFLQDNGYCYFFFKKIKFYCVCFEMFSLIESFLSSRRL